MTIAIIGAMEEEVSLLREAMKITETKNIAHVEFTEGILNNKEVVLLKSGIGKVNVAIATTLLLQNYNVSCVINTGSAGGLHPDTNIGDVVISNGTLHHDADVTGFGYALGQIPGLPATFSADKNLMELTEKVLKDSGKTYWQGQIGTGDSFINRPDQIEKIRTNFTDLLALEMEAAAVAQVCHQFEVPFIIVRALSDIAGKESHISFNDFLPVAAKESSEMVIELVGRI
ncbi:MAG: 5'-methylthioadenosine/S-adenosylhomocysteine nucleosidase [Turicibacter sp.]